MTFISADPAQGSRIAAVTLLNQNLAGDLVPLNKLLSMWRKKQARTKNDKENNKIALHSMDKRHR